MKEKFFKHKECLITYNISKYSKDSLVYFEKIKKGDLFCYIDLVKVEDHARGNGLAKEALTIFLKKLEKEGIFFFHLFANYDYSYYDNPSNNGLRRLINLYEKFGFKHSVKDFDNSDQIDMTLSI